MTRLVVKLGGRVASDSLGPVLARHAAGDQVVVVHGAGAQISAELRERELPVQFVAGRRVTDRATLAVVRAALSRVGAELAASLGPTAVHLVGDEIGLRATLVSELGLVGEPSVGSLPAIEEALAARRIPVVTPIAVGPLNVNADEAAAAIAAGIRADQVVFVSDVPGVYLDGAVRSVLRVHEATALLDAGAFEGGIVPKLMAAVRAARLGLAVEIGETAVVA